MSPLQAPTLEQRIDYLVLRRFPRARMLNIAPSLNSDTVTLDTLQLRADVDAYRAELHTLSAEVLNERYVGEKNEEADEQRAKAEAEEAARFFNQPYTNADFEHWSKTAHWTLDEAVALSFGKAPEWVTWEKVKPFQQVSLFAVQYGRRRDLALRSKQWEQLYDPVLPGIFLAWAKRLDIAVPSELEAAVVARGIQIRDWQSLYEDQKEVNEKYCEMYEGHISDWKDVVRKRDEFIDVLKSRIHELQAAPPPDKPLTSREQESLLKLVVGMAVRGYGYDPKAERSPQIPEIASDLALAGISMSDDTVRKWLRAAAELLPPR